MGKPIRILLTIADLAGGGAERQFSLLLRHLSRTRFEPHLCFWRPVFHYDYPQEVPVHMVTKTRPWHVFRAIKELRDLIDTLKPQLIYSQLHYVNMLTGTALAYTNHHARWVCRQSNDPRREMHGPFATWARWALQRADCVVGCSEGVRQMTIEHLRLDPKRVRRIDNIADVEDIARLAEDRLPIQAPSGVFRIVHAGRFHRQKNQALLLTAFSRFRGQPVELWMLGQGPLLPQLRRQAEQLGITAQIKWLGFQKNPFPFFRAADCLALSSDYEGLPNVVIEAMLCGTPVVSTRCPFGPDELIETGTGFLVPVGDTAAFGAALASLQHDPCLARRMGATAQKHAAARFHAQTTCRTYEDLFANIVHEGMSCEGL